MQATCDAKCRFLDVSIRHPAATSDYLAFVTSLIHHKVSEAGFLADGLCLFGDNAYVSNHYMVTPFPNVSEGERFHFNFYQSQLRIRIEMAFGMLVHWWSILRKPMPCTITVKKTTALVYSLCKLHNFCINEKEDQFVTNTAQDEFVLDLDGGIAMETTPEGYLWPSELLDGSDHHEASRQVDACCERQNKGRHIPHDGLLCIIRNNSLTRPTPRGWM